VAFRDAQHLSPGRREIHDPLSLDRPPKVVQRCSREPPFLKQVKRKRLLPSLYQAAAPLSIDTDEELIPRATDALAPVCTLDDTQVEDETCNSMKHAHETVGPPSAGTTIDRPIGRCGECRDVALIVGYGNCNARETGRESDHRALFHEGAVNDLIPLCLRVRSAHVPLLSLRHPFTPTSSPGPRSPFSPRASRSGTSQPAWGPRDRKRDRRSSLWPHGKRTGRSAPGDPEPQSG